MLRLGLTGGIASGKSAVAAMLREMGFAVLDADSLAHRLIERGEPAHEEILREFGPAITDASGRINRVQLANVVFADRAKLDRLNAIVHPRVADVVFRQFDEWERNGIRDAAFVEAALLIEAGLDKKLDRSEEHTSELQSRLHLVCRLLLEKKKKNQETTLR